MKLGERNQMSKKNKLKGKETLCTMPFGKYNESFELLKMGEKRNLKDEKSAKNSSFPVVINDEKIYLTEPDGKLIPNMENQQKCDFLIYCQNRPQTCFIELKGENISAKDSYNPYNQIIDTINFLHKKEELKELVNTNVEKHAFIVSPGRQKIPKGIESKERQLWQKLVQTGVPKSKISALVHYVKVTKSNRYSNNIQIICSPKSPVQIPFSSQS